MLALELLRTVAYGISDWLASPGMATAQVTFMSYASQFGGVLLMTAAIGMVVIRTRSIE